MFDSKSWIFMDFHAKEMMNIAAGEMIMPLVIGQAFGTFLQHDSRFCNRKIIENHRKIIEKS